jgi:DNA repair protein RadC
MPRSTRCDYCPALNRKSSATQPTHSLFLHEETIWPSYDHSTKRQERALREAIAPYICVAELRRLAAHKEDVQMALKDREDVPEEVQALFTLLRAVLAPRSDERIEKSADIASLLMVEMGLLDHEEFWLICLDMKNHVQRINRLYKGSLNSTVVRTGELFRLPLLLNSASIIVAHSHPSGVVQPSQEDIDTTRVIVQAGALLQIEVLDHLIIGQGAWLSMRDKRVGGWEVL